MQLQVGVKIFLQNEAGDFLLVRRSAEKYGPTRGSWDIVGGRIDPGQPLIDNLRREVKEETRLEIISEPRLVAAQDILLPDKHVVRLTYHGQTRGEPVLDKSENVEYRWADLREMLAEADLDIYAKEIIEKYRLK